MIGDTFVIDAVVHGYNLSPENQRGPASAELAAALYYGVHRGFSPRGQEQWVLDAERFFHGHNPDLLAHALFAESQTDVGIYHGVPAYGMFTDGGSPLWVGKEIRTRYPGRMLLYGPISPWLPNAVEEVDRDQAVARLDRAQQVLLVRERRAERLLGQDMESAVERAADERRSSVGEGEDADRVYAAARDHRRCIVASHQAGHGVARCY